MKLFAGKIKICKTPGCNKESWIDGYCKKCADYIIQKKTLYSLEENSKLMLDITTNMKHIEQRLSNIESGERNINYKQSIDPSPVFKPRPIRQPVFDKDIFVPSIDKNDATIINSKLIIKSDKNISDIVKKLPNI